jgi:hypothetical protein
MCLYGLASSDESATFFSVGDAAGYYNNSVPYSSVCGVADSSNSSATSFDGGASGPYLLLLVAWPRERRSWAEARWK